MISDHLFIHSKFVYPLQSPERELCENRIACVYTSYISLKIAELTGIGEYRGRQFRFPCTLTQAAVQYNAPLPWSRFQRRRAPQAMYLYEVCLGYA